MKGRYAGRRMTIYGAIMPGAVSIANWANKIQPLTEEAKKRLKKMQDNITKMLPQRKQEEDKDK